MILGIDISKRYFDATLRLSAEDKGYQRFTNDSAGITALLHWVGQQGVTELHACMEATNLYWEEVAEQLHAQGYRVSVVNPARIKGFAQSQLRRTKTDKLDSEVIADFCASQTPKAWQPPDESQRKLRNLERYRDDLLQTLTQQKNRLASSKDAEVRQSLGRLIEQLNQELTQIEQHIADHIQQEEELRHNEALLRSIPGIGVHAAHKLLAELYDLPHYANARAAAADAGLTPSQHESGDTVRRRPKLSKIGKTAIRRILFWPAITAMRCNPLLKPFADRLKARHKPTKVIIAAVMRKLLHLAYGVLKHQSPFDPNYPLRPRPAT
jgi:transposase